MEEVGRTTSRDAMEHAAHAFTVNLVVVGDAHAIIATTNTGLIRRIKFLTNPE